MLSVDQRRDQTRPEELQIVIFDCETTGTDRAADQIIELCVQRGLDSAAPGAVTTWRIKPAVPIHPGAQAVHGIAMADLERCPAFGDVADAIAEVFANADVVIGYNVTFDIEMLQAEYARLDPPFQARKLDFANKQIVDAFRLWQQCEPRSLQHAHQRFVGNQFEAAHSASADVAATGRVLSGMLRHFKLDDRDWAQIANVCDPGRASWVGPSRHLRWEGDVIVLGSIDVFGKHGGVPVHQLAAGPERELLHSMVESREAPPLGDGPMLPAHVCDVVKKALETDGETFLAWAREHFGQPAPTSQPPFVR
ncbi:MAG: 3'-5' exonuclease [Kofleriaceae bacterium]